MGDVAQIYKSITRHTTDMIATLNSEGHGPIQFQNWESRADEEKLPQLTLLGPDGFSFDENKGLWRIRYGLALSSFHDKNLLDEIEILDRIQELSGEKKKVKLLNLTTGVVEDELIVIAWSLLPMSQSLLRNYRTIGIELHRTTI